ncbi:MAG: hypothetical protein M0Z48_06435 [Nitrospiraceae bacterium]|nr:hypothetical protein [Nitrospiraceae bacterium]
MATVKKTGKKKSGQSELAKYLLRLPEGLRLALRKEALDRDTDMSRYIASILERRKELKGI